MQKTIRFMMVVPFISIFLYGGQMTQEAFDQTLKKCEIQENSAACARLYYYFISSKHSYLADLQADKQKALYYAKKGCRLNDRDGCFSAGMTLYYGDQHAGIATDRDEGRRVLKKACTLGKDDVCTFFLNPNF